MLLSNQHLIICQLAGKKSGRYAEARQTGGSAHRLTYLVPDHVDLSKEAEQS